MVRLVPQSVKNGIYKAWHTGYDPILQSARSLSRSARSRTAGLLSTTGSDNAVTNVSELAVEALKNKTKMGGDDENSPAGIGFYNGIDFYNEQAARSLLTDISIDLTLPDGRLNKNSILLNDGEAIAALINLSKDQDFSTQFRADVKDLLAQLLTASAKQRGLLSAGCPIHIVEILRNNSSEDDQTAKVARYQAAAQFIVSLADKNKKRLEVQDTVNDFLDKMNGYFHGAVAEQVQPILEQSIHEFLSNPQAIFTDKDLDIHPNVLRDFSLAIANLFESGVTKPLRQDSLVQAAKNLIAAFEVEDRNYGSHTAGSLGINSARKAFIDQWINERVSLINQTREISRLKDQRRAIRQGVDSRMPVKVDRAFCTAAEKSASTEAILIVVPSNTHILEIDNRIKKLETENHDSTTKFNTKMIAIKSSFEKIASPVGEGELGIKNLFFERLFGQDANGEKISEQGFLEHFLSKYDQEGIDYSQLTDPTYGSDFTGVNKLMLDRLREISNGLTADIALVQRHEAELATEKSTLDANFWNPLKEILPIDKHMDQVYIDKLRSNLRAFCLEEAKTATTVQSVEALQKKTFDIVKHLITIDANTNERTLNTGLLANEAGSLTQIDINEISQHLQVITAAMDTFYAIDDNSGKSFDWSAHTTEINQIMSILRTKVPPITPAQEENPNAPVRLGKLIAEESDLYHSALGSIARVFQHEQSALNSVPAQLVAKVASFTGAMGLTNIATLISNDLISVIPRANFLRTVNSNNQSLIERYQAMQSPNHPKYKEYWDQQAERMKMDVVFSSGTHQDLINMGLDQRNARILERTIEDYSETFNIDPHSEFSFVTIINDLLQKLFVFIQSLGAQTHV
jgi:hypothetical protein